MTDTREQEHGLAGSGAPVTNEVAGGEGCRLPDVYTGTLLSLEQAERVARGAQIFMQTVRARALRIDQVRRLLDTLTEAERIALLAEALGATEDEMFAVLEAGTAALIATAPRAQGDER